MFACLHSLSAPVATLLQVAEVFTPRYEVVGPLVMLDISGLTTLFGTLQDLGEHMRRAASGPVRIALSPTQTTAALLALGRPGLQVVVPGDDQAAAIAALPVALLGDLERLRFTRAAGLASTALTGPHAPVLRERQKERESLGEVTSREMSTPHSVARATDATATPVAGVVITSGGWAHPRASHAAARTRRVRHTATYASHASASGSAAVVADPAAGSYRPQQLATPVSPAALRTQQTAVHEVLDTLRRWGVRTCGELAALPPAAVFERLGARGVMWQRLTRGADLHPLVPWVPEEPFAADLALEWPIEGLEPLSFVLGRLLEPLAERLERADRGAAILHTHLGLVDKTAHIRMLQLPAAMRDARTLRTLLLLDLEAHPPGAGIDHVRVVVEPTPARVTQWTLFDRAQASPEQVSTLLARLSALMGESHVGAPALVDSWKPGAFAMAPFTVSPAAMATPMAATPATVQAPTARAGPSSSPTAQTALRRFRLPVPTRVQVQEGRPVRIITDRRGVSGGRVTQAAGPWRTSGEWWNDAVAPRTWAQHWDRDEWDVAIEDGTVYRLFVERAVGQWFLDGIVD